MTAPVRARDWTLPGLAALAAVGALALAAPATARDLQWVPLLAGLVLFALPHGAVDHHVPRRLHRRGGARFVAGYLAAVVAGLVLWALAPVATFAAFLAVAALHWGAGDAWYARAVHGRARFGSRVRAAWFVGARGALPVALPALAHPADLAAGAGAVLGVVGASAPAAPAGAVRAAGLAVVAVLALGAAWAAWADRRGAARGAVAADAGELVLLAAFFLATPAVLAVGTYLVAWHAPRHVARLIALEPRQAALARRRPLAAVALWAREAAPLTAVSLAGLAALALTAWRVEASAPVVGGAALALIAALTFPHAAVVAAMDRVEGVFRPAGGAR